MYVVEDGGDGCGGGGGDGCGGVDGGGGEDGCDWGGGGREYFQDEEEKG